MAGLTLEIAEQRLADYLAAELAVLGGQSYTIMGSRSMTRANLAEIREGIKFWRSEVQEFEAKRTRIPRSITPRPRF